MKSILVILLFITNLFSLSLEERVNLLEKRVNILEKELNVSKSNIHINSIKNCSGLQLLSYSYKFKNAVIAKVYNFNYKLKNNYAKEIKYLSFVIKYFDQDNTELLQDYIEKSRKISKNKIFYIKSNYLLEEGSLAEYLKDTPKNELKVELHPYVIIFSDGQKIKCN